MWFRFSKDIESIDKDVPMNANMTMSNMVWTALLMIVISIMSVYFVIIVAVAFVLFCTLMVSPLLLFVLELEAALLTYGRKKAALSTKVLYAINRG